jgi:uncharacterized protein
MAPSQDTVVVDEPSESRFKVKVGRSVAQLVYRDEGDRLVLVHTEVPEEIGGRGIAGLLVRSAVDRAVDGGLTIVPVCPYARRWLEEHPDEAARVRIDWPPPRHRT